MALATRLPGAWASLALLLGINLFNYIDRYVLYAVEPEIRRAFFAPGDPAAMAKTGMLASAFLVSYMVLAPVFGWLADRFSRWMLVAAGLTLWSLASGASGLAATFVMLLITRVFVGAGEAAYGPAAPTLLADYFAPSARGRVLSLFYLAIPVGSALGYVAGGSIGSAWGWRWPFFLVTLPGVLLALVCLTVHEPRPTARAKAQRGVPLGAVLKSLGRNRSFLFNTAAMTAMTFAMNGLAYWMPAYVHDFRGQPGLGRINTLLGGITVIAGLLATFSGGWLADGLKRRHAGAYFWVSGAGMIIAFPLTVALLFTPFPYFWGVLFAVEFFLFFNTGPANAALVEMTSPAIRSTAFAINIFIIHALGDAISPPLTGAIADHWQMNAAFLVVSGMIAISGLFWISGAKYLKSDTDAEVTPPRFTES